MTSFKVIIQGLEKDVDANSAISQLATLFKTTPERVAVLIRTPRYIVKSGLDEPTAAKYAAALKARGCVVTVVEEVPPPEHLEFEGEPAMADSSGDSAAQATDVAPNKRSLTPVAGGRAHVILSGALAVVALWGGYQYFVGTSVGALRNPFQDSPALHLNREEQDEVARIKGMSAFNLLNGYPLSALTRLAVHRDDFGEKPSCIVVVAAAGAHPRWSLRVQVNYDGSENVWAVNQLSNNAGEVRLAVGDQGHVYRLDKIGSEPGSRGASLDQELRNDLMTANSARAISGVMLDRELSFNYDLSTFAKAYKYAKAICTPKDVRMDTASADLKSMD